MFLAPGLVELRSGAFDQQAHALQSDPELAVVAQDVGVLAAMAGVGAEPGAALLAAVLARFLEGALGDTQEQVGEMQLGDQRAQAGERRAQRARLQQQLGVLDAHPLEGGAAAVGLPLADVVPVVVQADAGASAGNGGDQQFAAGAFVHGGGDQHFRVAGAGAEALLAGELVPAVELLHHCAGVERIQGVAPEPVLARGLLEPGLPLLGAGEQAHGGEHQVLEAEDVGDGAVDAGEFAHHFEGLAPAGADAAVLGGDRQGQQATGAQRIALGLGGAAAGIAFHGALGELFGESLGCLQRFEEGGLLMQAHGRRPVRRSCAARRARDCHAAPRQHVRRPGGCAPVAARWRPGSP
ncbi:hypothetical protein D9M70_428630 [compost metagenome]